MSEGTDRIVHTDLPSFARELRRRRELRDIPTERAELLAAACRDGRMERWVADEKRDKGAETTCLYIHSGKGIFFTLGSLQAHLPYHFLAQRAQAGDTVLMDRLRVLLGPERFEVLRGKMGETPDTRALLENLDAELADLGESIEGNDERERVMRALIERPHALASVLASGAPLSRPVLVELIRSVPEGERTPLVVAFAYVAERTAREIALHTGADYPPTADAAQAFDAVKGQLNVPAYTSVMEIVETLLTPEASDAIRQGGMSLVRGAFKDKTEGLMLFGPDALSRVFLDPSKLSREQSGSYTSIASLQRQQFQSVDRICSTRQEFVRARHALLTALSTRDSERLLRQDARDTFTRAASSIASAVVSDVPGSYLELRGALVPLMRALREKRPLRIEDITTCERLLADIDREYRVARFATLDPQRFVEANHPSFEDKDVEASLQDLPQAILDKRDDQGRISHYDPVILDFLREHPIRYRIVYQPDGAPLPRSRIPAALNRLGVKPGPTIRIETGSAFLTDPDELAATRTAAEMIVSFADERGCNLGISDTQAGGGGVICQEVLFARDRRGDEFGAIPYTVSPGKTVFLIGDPLSSGGSDAEGKVRYTGNPVATLVTDEAAHWSDAPELTQYAKQSEIERLCDALAGRGENATVVLNGGPRVVMKVNMDIAYGSTILIVRKTGRFADIAAAVTDAVREEGIATWQSMSDEAIMTRIKALIPQLPAYTQAQSTKDIDSELGRAELVRFVHSIGTADIRVIDADDLKDVLARTFPHRI
jgi:hypothetical protein